MFTLMQPEVFQTIAFLHALSKYTIFYWGKRKSAAEQNFIGVHTHQSFLLLSSELMERC